MTQQNQQNQPLSGKFLLIATLLSLGLDPKKREVRKALGLTVNPVRKVN